MVTSSHRLLIRTMCLLATKRDTLLLDRGEPCTYNHQFFDFFFFGICSEFCRKAKQNVDDIEHQIELHHTANQKKKPVCSDEMGAPRFRTLQTSISTSSNPDLSHLFPRLHLKAKRTRWNRPNFKPPPTYRDRSLSPAARPKPPRRHLDHHRHHPAP